MRIKDTGDQEIAYRDFWLPMQASLDSEQTNFLWRYLNKDGTFVRLNGIYDAVKKKLAKKNSNEVVDVLMEMDTYSKYYLRLINPENEPELEIRQRFHRLNRWEVKTAYPFLLNIYHSYAQRHISKSDLCQILDMIESFVIRRFFCRVPTNILNKLFISLYNSLDKDNLLESLEVELLRQNWPNDNEFIQALERFPIYTSGTRKCRHILETLEDTLLDNNEPVDFNYSKITIETLTGQNSPMGNSPFHKKSVIFEKSNFALNKSLEKLDWWNAEKIVQRAKELGQVAITIWRHPGIEVSGTDRHYSADDPTGFKPTGFRLFLKEYQVETWREMLLNVLRLLAEKHGKEFSDKAINVKTSRRTHISFSTDGLITPMQIEGTDLYVEANQSSRSVLWLILQTIEALGHSEDDFEAYWNN